MIKNKYNRQEIIEEWLSLYVIRQFDFEMDGNNQAVVLVPHSDSWLTRKLLPKPRNPNQKVHLDEIGTFIWLKMDGTRTLKEICVAVQEKFGIKVESCQERTVLFAQQMFKQNFIKVYSKREEKETNTTSD
jgi:hypothetical protein